MVEAIVFPTEAGMFKGVIEGGVVSFPHRVELVELVGRPDGLIATERSEEFHGAFV